jgi:deoxyribodipyrimidine photo-lyase
MSAIVWYRRDLRVHDHPALRAALVAHDVVVPAFCLDERLLHGRHSSGARTQFLLDCLHDLDASLRKRGSGLVVLHGPPERELARLAQEIGASELHYTADVSPFARERGRRTQAALRELGGRDARPSRIRRTRRSRLGAHPIRQPVHSVLAVSPHVGARAST